MTPVVASVVEEELFGIEESPDEDFVGLTGGQEGINRFWCFAFLGGSGSWEGLVLFPL